jgi:hypothetical protein
MHSDTDLDGSNDTIRANAGISQRDQQVWGGIEDTRSRNSRTTP